MITISMSEFHNHANAAEFAADDPAAIKHANECACGLGCSCGGPAIRGPQPEVDLFMEAWGNAAAAKFYAKH